MPTKRPKIDAAAAPTLSGAEIVRELAACGADACFFIDHYYCIYERRPDGSFFAGRITMWDYQARLVTAYMAGGHYMILKARQLGITTITVGYILWFALFRQNAYILLLSKDEPEAEYLLERISEAYKRLPAWMQQWCPPGETWNTETITFANGTRIESKAATARTGRSRTASLIFVDEADYVEDLRVTYQGIKPTVDGAGGQVILASTSQGPLRYWSELWELARSHAGKLRGVFFPWPVRPGRTQEWLDQETAEYSSQQRRREYPARWQDCFSSAEELVYPEFDPDVHVDRLEPYNLLTQEVTTARYGTFKIRYTLGAQDWNTAQPGCLLVGAVATDGTLLILDGYYQKELPIESRDPSVFTWADVAVSFQQTYRWQKVWCDHQADGILAYKGRGIPAVLAIKDVDSGIAAVKALLALRRRVDERGAVTRAWPGLIISDKLTFFQDEFHAYKRRTIGGVITEMVIKSHDHAADSLRYMAQGMSKGEARITVIG